MSEPTFTLPMDALAIRALLPHRYPFLLIDRVLELEPGERIVTRKLVSQNEPYLEGHFPDYPVVPGVLQIEMIAQSGALLIKAAPDEASAGKIAMLTGADDFKFRRQLLPGDVATITVDQIRFRRGFGKAHGTVTVEDQLCAEGWVSFALVGV